MINQTDGEEWCFVHAITPLADPENDKDYVEAKDLELYQNPILKVLLCSEGAKDEQDE